MNTFPSYPIIISNHEPINVPIQFVSLCLEFTISVILASFFLFIYWECFIEFLLCTVSKMSYIRSESVKQTHTHKKRKDNKKDHAMEFGFADSVKMIKERHF